MTVAPPPPPPRRSGSGGPGGACEGAGPARGPGGRTSVVEWGGLPGALCSLPRPHWSPPCAPQRHPRPPGLSVTALMCLLFLARKTNKQVFVSYNLQNTDSNFALLVENRIKEEMDAFPEKF